MKTEWEEEKKGSTNLLDILLSIMLKGHREREERERERQADRQTYRHTGMQTHTYRTRDT